MNPEVKQNCFKLQVRSPSRQRF